MRAFVSDDGVGCIVVNELILVLCRWQKKDLIFISESLISSDAINQFSDLEPHFFDLSSAEKMLYQAELLKVFKLAECDALAKELEVKASAAEQAVLAVESCMARSLGNRRI